MTTVLPDERRIIMLGRLLSNAALEFEREMDALPETLSLDEETASFDRACAIPNGYAKGILGIRAQHPNEIAIKTLARIWMEDDYWSVVGEGNSIYDAVELFTAISNDLARELRRLPTESDVFERYTLCVTHLKAQGAIDADRPSL